MSRKRNVLCFDALIYMYFVLFVESNWVVLAWIRVFAIIDKIKGKYNFSNIILTLGLQEKRKNDKRYLM